MSTAYALKNRTMRCHTCGRFMEYKIGVAVKMTYSGYPPTPEEEIYRCVSCVDTYGGFDPQHGVDKRSVWFVE